MGLFTFLKNAGAKLLGNSAKKNEEIEAAKRAADEARAAALAEEMKQEKIAVLTNMVKNGGVPIDDVTIDMTADDSIVVYGMCNTVADKEKIVLMLGNVEGICCVDDRISVSATEPESTFYEVKKGDSLSKIAKEVYGNPMKYPVIFEANKPMLKDPDLIYPGQMLRIPPIA